MKQSKSIKTFLLGILMCVSGISFAQERILDELFPTVTVQKNVTYGWNWSVFATAEDQTGTSFGPLTQYVDSLRMDVYLPTGDVSTSRPVILLSHAGSYLPNTLTGVPFGTKDDSCMIELCTRFAKRGFVAVSFEYRKGWNPQGNQETRTSTIVQAVYKGAHDAKSAIRFLKANASTYGINPNQIILGGSNSGAYHALLAGNLNKPSELGIFKFLDGNGNPMIDTTLWGNFDGANGALSNYNTPGQSSAFQMVLSLGGCVGDTSWVDPGEVPVIAFHGVNDGGSPYHTGIVYTGAGGVPIIEVSGPGDYMPLIDGYNNNAGIDVPAPCNQGPASTNATIYQGNYPFYGAGFEPWGWYDTTFAGNPSASRARASAYIDTIMSYVADRAYRLFINPNYDCTTVGMASNNSNISLDLFPNPANTSVTIKLNDFSNTITSVGLYNISGQLVRQHPADNSNTLNIERKNLDTGMYFVNIKLSNGQSVNRKLLFE
jgi:hypothetical protein